MLGFIAPGNVCPLVAGGGRSCARAIADSDHSAPIGAPKGKALMALSLSRSAARPLWVTGRPLVPNTIGGAIGGHAPTRASVRLAAERAWALAGGAAVPCDPARPR